MTFEQQGEGDEYLPKMRDAQREGLLVLHAQRHRRKFQAACGAALVVERWGSQANEAAIGAREAAVAAD